MNTHLNTKRILIFLAFAFGITWTADLALYLTVGKDDLLTAGLLANYIFAIWSPALANVATRLITKEGWGHTMVRPNFRRGWRFYLAAWLLPSLAIVVGAAIFYVLFPQSFNSSLGEVRELFAGSALETWAAEANSWTLLLAFALQIMSAMVAVLTIVSFGEEFGWRAYLLPKLMERFAGAQRASISADDPPQPGGLDAAGSRKAALLIGVIWGVWHWPARVLFSGMPLLYLLLDLVPICSLSILLTWVTLRSGSMWPAAVGHSAHNSALNLVAATQKGPANPLLGPGPSGLISGIAYLALALVLLFRRKALIPEDEPGSEKGPAVSGAQKHESLA